MARRRRESGKILRACAGGVRRSRTRDDQASSGHVSATSSSTRSAVRPAPSATCTMRARSTSASPSLDHATASATRSPSSAQPLAASSSPMRRAEASGPSARSCARLSLVRCCSTDRERRPPTIVSMDDVTTARSASSNFPSAIATRTARSTTATSPSSPTGSRASRASSSGFRVLSGFMAAGVSYDLRPRGGKSAERLLVHAVLLVDLRAHRADAEVDRRVVLPRPGELGPLVALREPALGDLHVHRGRERAVALHVLPVLLAHAEQDEARGDGVLDLGAPEELGPAEGEHAAAHVGDHLVEVRHRDAHARGAAVDLGDERDVRVQHELEIGGDLVELRAGDRDVAPLARPGLVVDLHDHAELLAHLLDAHRAEDDLGHLLHRLPRLARPLVEARLVVVVPAEEVLLLRVAGLLREPALVGAGVGHVEHGGVLEALDEHADLLVRVERHRAVDALHALLAQPALGALEQGARDVLVVDRVEVAEVAGVVLPRVEPGAVDGGGGPADEAAVLPRGEERDLRVLVDGILLRV